MIYKCNPKTQLPSATTIKRRITELYDIEKNNLKNLIQVMNFLLGLQVIINI